MSCSCALIFSDIVAFKTFLFLFSFCSSPCSSPASWSKLLNSSCRDRTTAALCFFSFSSASTSFSKIFCTSFASPTPSRAFWICRRSSCFLPLRPSFLCVKVDFCTFTFFSCASSRTRSSRAFCFSRAMCTDCFRSFRNNSLRSETRTVSCVSLRSSSSISFSLRISTWYQSFFPLPEPSSSEEIASSAIFYGSCSWSTRFLHVAWGTTAKLRAGQPENER
mmetsp:Transcript_5868/g.14595  ORF Transcript_5868/g.14595 Transcript_5868/m.14595 type:complete len:221 (+) Transcript_5868:1077-1739(+)